MEDESKPILYILMRNDLPSMNPGKAMAQAAHAANAFESHFGKNNRLYKKWKEESVYGFGTTIVLSANKKQAEFIFSVDSVHEVFTCGKVIDHTYPYVVNHEVASLIPVETDTLPRCVNENGTLTMFREEMTCSWIFMDAAQECKTLVEHLPLHP